MIDTQVRAQTASANDASEHVSALEAVTEHLWMLVPGILVVYLGFDAGGYFAGTTGAAAAGAMVLTAIRLLTVDRSRLGPTRSGAVALIGIGGFAALSLISQAWSHAAARALLSFDLALLYLAVTALCGGVRQHAGGLRTMIVGLLLAVAGVCAAGFLTRTLPHVFILGANLQTPRLSYPVTYWNGLGMMAAFGILLAGHTATDREFWVPVRVLAAALVPVLAVTLLLTYSRGAILALAVGLVIYVVLGMQSSLLSTVLTTGPFAAIALRVTYSASRLSSQHPTSPGAVAQGHHVAAVVGACMAGAGALRGLLLLVDRRIPHVRAPRRTPVVVGFVLTLGAIAFAVGAQGWITRQYHHFVSPTSSLPARAATAARLTSVSNGAHLPLWRVALKGFDRQPIRGLGAGTYVLQWERARAEPETVQDAHSLYLQTLAELGLAGAAALTIFLAGLFLGAFSRMRLPEGRATGALAFAGLAAWGVHCAVDWDWQLPAVTVPVLALAAAAATRLRPLTWPLAPLHRLRDPLLSRVLPATVCVAVGIAPCLVAVSQADLDASVVAFKRDDCSMAVEKARAAHEAAGSRPEPLEILGYCLARERHPRGSVDTIEEAIARDPGDWEFRYALAVVTAAAGGNPQPALHAARRRDRLEPLLIAADEAFKGRRGSLRRRIALGLKLDIP